MTDDREFASAIEWLDQEQGAAPNIELPDPDEDYCYAAMRLFSWWPVVNSRGATYEREDFSDDLLKTLLGKQVNLVHDKLNKVIGSIIGYAVNPDGVDIAVRIDREQAAHHDLSVDDMHKGGYFSQCSLELTKDPDGSHFYAYDDGFNVHKKIPVITGRRLGIRRTRESDPYLLQGMKVAERIKPARFTGVGLVPRPADKTAQLYAVTASEDDLEDRPLNSEELFIELLSDDFDLLMADGDLEVAAAEREDAMAKKALTPGSNYADPGYKGVKKYPLDSEGHVRSAARFWGIASYRSGYTPEQQAHISAAIARAKKKYGIGSGSEKADTGVITVSDTDREMLVGKVAELELELKTMRSEKETASTEYATKVSELEARIGTLETELASANEKIAGYEQEKAAAEHNAKVDEIMASLNEIFPIEEGEREAIREKASHFCDDRGVVHELRAARFEKKVAALEAASKPAAEAPAPAAEPKPGDGGGPSGPGKGEGGGRTGEPGKGASEKASEEEEFASEEDARQDLEPPVKVTINGKTVEYEAGKYI